MRTQITILLSFLVTVGFSQVRPDQFLEQTNPTNANFEFYSQKGGAPRRATFTNVKKNMVPFVTDTLAGVPTATGNLTNLGEFIWDQYGALWYIDGEGDAVSFTGGGPIYVLPDTTAQTLVYAPSHGLTDTITLYGYVPVKADFTRANSSAVDSSFIAYAIDAPHPDSLLLVFSGLLTYVTWHGKEINTQYYLQDDGSEDTTPGTISIPTAIASDSLTLFLREVGADIAGRLRRIAMPSPLITAFGGNPASPTDSVVQAAIVGTYLPAGLAQPGTIFTLSYATQSYNPTYQQTAPNTNPLTPSYAWLWDGAYVTRIANVPTSVDLQDTIYGTLGTLVLTPIDSIAVVLPPTDQEVAVWLQVNYGNGLRLANGSLLYYVGSGTRQQPEYLWTVIDDVSYDPLATDWEKITRRIESPSYVNAALDVDTLGIQIDDILKWNGSEWVPVGRYAINGLSMSGDTAILGGTLDRNTIILGSLKDFTITETGVINFDSRVQTVIGVNTDYNANKHSISDWYVGSDSATWYQELQSASYDQNVYDYAQVDSSSDAASWNLYVKANSKWIADEISVSNSNQSRRFYGNTGSGNWQYYWPTSSPSSVLSTKSLMTWTGTGSTATPTFETAAAVVSAGGGAYGSGLAGRTAYWLDDSTLVHTDITYSSTELNASALTGSFQWPTGTTAQQPVGANGKTRFNSTTGLFEGYHDVAYRPFATFDGTRTSGRIPYWDGTKLTSTGNMVFVGDEVRLGSGASVDYGAYDVQINGSFRIGIGYNTGPALLYPNAGQNLSWGPNGSFSISGNPGPASKGINAEMTGGWAALFGRSTSGYGVWAMSTGARYAINVGSEETNGYGLLFSSRSSYGNTASNSNHNKQYILDFEYYRTAGSVTGTWIGNRIQVGYDNGEIEKRETKYDFKLRRSDETNQVTALFLTGSNMGRVGIFTDSPTAVLDVNGNTRIRTMPDSVAAYITMADASGYIYRATPGDVVSAGSGSTNSIYNLLPTQDILIDPNTNDLIIGSFGAGNSGDFEFFTTNENGQYVGIFAGTRDSSWLAAGEGFQFDAALFSTGAEDGIMGVGYNYFGTVWNAAIFADSILFAPYPSSELTMTINGLTDIAGTGYKVMVQDTVSDRVYLTDVGDLPITELLRDSVTTTTITVDLETRYQKVVQIDMTSATNLTLTINNPTDAGVYTFHFLGVSGTDNVTWPAAFYDANNTALGTDALTAGTMYTCYYSSADAKYFCK